MRRIAVACVIAALVVCSVPAGVTADETVLPDEPLVTRAEVEAAVLKALDWFAEIQYPDGGWFNSPGVTAFVIMAYANAGFDETNQTVSKGLEFMRNFYNPEEGHLGQSFLNYESALSLMAMNAVGDPEDTDKLSHIRQFMEGYQFHPGGELTMVEDWYDGGWPNYAAIPDISNSQFAILGLLCEEIYNASYQVPDATWEKATEFIHGMQNIPGLNPLDWANNASKPSYGDGGFVYNGYRSRTPLGEDAFESYGSITAAGVFAYLATGNTPAQDEVAAAKAWVDSEFTFDHNPRMEDKGIYYYLWSQSRALSMWPSDYLVDASGKLHDWRQETARHFLDLQLPNGGFEGNPQNGWWEEQVEVAGMYSVLCLQMAFMTAPDPELTIEVTGADGATFRTAMGEELTTDATRGVTVSGSTLSCTDPDLFAKTWVDIEGSSGTATVTATGTWGDDRTSSVSEDITLGASGGLAFVSAGAFAGPFGLHIIDYGPGADAAVIENDDIKDVGKLQLKRGETRVLSIEVDEAVGSSPLNDITLFVDLPEGVVADVGTQAVDVDADGKTTVNLTITIPADADKGDAGQLVIYSSTAPPVVIPVEYVDEFDDGGDDDGAPGFDFWLLVLALFAAVAVFIALPRAGRRG